MSTPTPGRLTPPAGTPRPAPAVPPVPKPGRPATSPPRPGTASPGTSRPAPAAPTGTVGGTSSLPQIATSGVDPRVLAWALGVPLLVAAAVAAWVWLPAAAIWPVLAVLLAGAGLLVLRSRGRGRSGPGRLGRRPGSGVLGRRPGRPGGLMSGGRPGGRPGGRGLLGKPARPGSGRAGGGRGRDGRFAQLGRGLASRASRKFPRAAAAGRAMAGRARAAVAGTRGRLPRALGGTRPTGTSRGASRSGRPGGRLGSVASRLSGGRLGGASRPRGGRPSGTRGTSGGTSRPGTRPGGGTSGASRGSGARRGLLGLLVGPGRKRRGGSVAATDGDMTGRPSRDAATPDDPERDDTLPDDDEGGDVPGLSRWQRWGYSLADRLQSADLRRWVDALGEPLRRSPTPEFETGIDVDDVAPTDDMDIHTPAAWHDWPVDPGPAGYEWPPDDESPAATPEPSPPRSDPPEPDTDPDPDPTPAESPADDRHDDFPAVDPDGGDTGSAAPLPSPPDHREHRRSSMTSSDTPTRGTPGPAVPETYYDESTPGTRQEKLLKGARKAALDAQKESEGAQELRRHARAIEHIPGLHDDYEDLLTEARKQEGNAEDRLTIAAQFRAAADKQAASAA